MGSCLRHIVVPLFAAAVAALAPQLAHSQAQTYFDTHASVVGPLAGGRFGAAIDCSDGTASANVSRIAIGAPEAANGEGRVYVYTVADTPTLLATLQAPSPVSNYKFGSALAFIPDFNSDGIEDLIIGEPSDDVIRDPRIYVYQSDGVNSYTDCSYADRPAASFGTVIHGYRLFGNTLNRFIAGIPQIGSAIPYEITSSGAVCNLMQGASRFGGLGFGSSIASVVGDDDSDGEADTIIGAPLASSSAGALYLTGAGSNIIVTGSGSEEAGAAVAGHNQSNYYAFSRPKASSGEGNVAVRDLNYGGPLFSCTVTRAGSGTSADFGKTLKHLNNPGFLNLFPTSSAAFAAYRSEASTGGSVAIFNTNSVVCSQEYQYNNCIADANQEQGAALAGGGTCTGNLGGSTKIAVLVGSPGYSSGRGRIDIVAEGSDHASPSACTAGSTPTPTPTPTPTATAIPVEPGTGKLPKPAVIVKGRTATVTAAKVKPKLTTPGRKKAIALLMKRGLSRKAAENALKQLVVTYVFTYRRRAVAADVGLWTDELDTLNSRTVRNRNNRISLRNLPPGQYSISYSVDVSTRSPPVSIGKTRASPNSSFTIRR